MWGISSQLLQQSTDAAPYLGNVRYSDNKIFSIFGRSKCPEILMKFKILKSLFSSTNKTHNKSLYMQMRKWAITQGSSFAQGNSFCWGVQVVLVVRNPPATAGDISDVSSIPGSGRSPGEGHGKSLQYSCLEYPMDRGNWGGGGGCYESTGSYRVRHDWSDLACRQEFKDIACVWSHLKSIQHWLSSLAANWNLQQS